MIEKSCNNCELMDNECPSCNPRTLQNWTPKLKKEEKMKNKIEAGSTVLISEEYFDEDLCNKKFKVIGTRNSGESILIQLTKGKGHDGAYITLDGGIKTKDLNLSDVWWVAKKYCELVSEYPKYMISENTLLVVKFTKERHGIVIVKNHVWKVGDSHDNWAMSAFRDLTEEEFKKYIKKYTLKELEGKNIVVHCDTINELKEFDQHIKLTNGNLPSSVWNAYTTDTCFKIYETGMTYGNRNYFESKGFEIIDFSEVNFNDEKESYEMKYKLLRDINGDALNKDGACVSEFDKYVTKYGFWKVCIWDEINEEYIMKQNGWLKFLLDKGYIKEVNSMIYDENKLYFCKIEGNWHKLHSIEEEDNEFGFITFKNNIHWRHEAFSEQETIDNVISAGISVYEYNTFEDFVESQF